MQQAIVIRTHTSGAKGRLLRAPKERFHAQFEARSPILRRIITSPTRLERAVIMPALNDLLL